ncbi:MAG: hypothetical protein K0S20_298 [Patescibacteria group bacterium]|nr:hypothetical protein [Patescibacteria group bacterium]
MKTLRSLVASLAVVCFMAGCGSRLPENLVERSKQLESQIAAKRQEVEKRANQLATSKKGQNASFLASYAQREKWEKDIADAQGKVSQAANLHTADIKPLVDQNATDKEAVLRRKLKEAETLLSEAHNLAAQPANRIAFLLRTKAEAPAMVAKARGEMAESRLLAKRLEDITDAAKSDFPKKKDDLQKRVGEVKGLVFVASEALDVATFQLAKSRKTGAADYALLGDNTVKVSQCLSSVKEKDQVVRAKITELDKTYSKILADMRVDYYVTFSKTTWDEWAEYDNDSDHTFNPVKVEKTVYDQYAALAEDSQVDASSLQGLGIDPNDGGSAGSSAEYYLDGVSERYYHKYIVVENGVKKEGDWQEVSEQQFDQHSDDLGMSIVSKARGEYEAETSQFATPAGMEYVGDKKYGHWQKDNSGTSYWEWYGRYRFYQDIFGPRYYYNDWDQWNRGYRGRSPYYGPKNDENDRYGTHGGYTSSHPRYAGSTWRSSGDYKAEAASVRSAGRAARGGGPGGGGK